MIDMPNSLRARLKKCVHKGVLKESDLERLIILPKNIESIEEVRSVYSRAYKEGYDAAMKEVKAIVFNRYSLVENSYEEVCALVRRWENDR
jgi:hypothetical protein